MYRTYVFSANLASRYGKLVTKTHTFDALQPLCAHTQLIKQRYCFVIHSSTRTALTLWCICSEATDPSDMLGRYMNMFNHLSGNHDNCHHGVLSDMVKSWFFWINFHLCSQKTPFSPDSDVFRALVMALTVPGQLAYIARCYMFKTTSLVESHRARRNHILPKHVGFPVRVEQWFCYQTLLHPS
jgi:hypothetical protein